MFALIQNTRVLQWSDLAFPVAPQLFWVQHDRIGPPDDCVYDGGDTISLKPTPTPPPAEVNDPIDAAIQRLENRQARSMRDILLGRGDTPDPQGIMPKQRLEDTDRQIDALHAQRCDQP